MLTPNAPTRATFCNWDPPDCVEVEFKTATFSNGANNCVEVGSPDGRIHVRNTKSRKPAHVFTRDEWDAFVKGVKAGEFDLP